MGRFTDIKLISTTKTVNEYGDWETVETSRTVYAEERSVGMQEFYQGFAVGLKPEIKFYLENFMDYQGEQIVEYTPFMGDKAIRLAVLRTFNAGDRLELTCYRGVDIPQEAEDADAEEPDEDAD